jgi:hypothetical protein
MAVDDDLPEYIGADKSTLAAPKGKRATPAPKAPAPPKDWAVTDTPQPDYEPAAHIEPAPRVTPYTPPAPGASHPKHAVLGPALRVDEAERALTAATLELTTATRHLRACELAEAGAEAVLMRELPGPTPDELLREHVASELKNRADNVAAGRSPDTRAIPVHGNSALDRIAANRPRPAPGMASSLRSATVRRTV